MVTVDADVIEIMIVESTQFANRRVQAPFISDPATDCVQTLADEDQRREEDTAQVLIPMSCGLSYSRPAGAHHDILLPFDRAPGSVPRRVSFSLCLTVERMACASATAASWPGG